MSGPGGQAAQAADLVAVLRSYVDRMLREVPGMKVLLLDSETTRVVSTVFSQSEILEQEVYLVERLEADKGDQLFHLKVTGGMRQREAAERPPCRLPCRCCHRCLCGGASTVGLRFCAAPRLSASCGQPVRTSLASGENYGTLVLASTTSVSVPSTRPCQRKRSGLSRALCAKMAFIAPSSLLPIARCTHSWQERCQCDRLCSNVFHIARVANCPQPPGAEYSLTPKCLFPACLSSVFTNGMEDMRLQDLAEMDVKEIVHEVRPCCIRAGLHRILFLRCCRPLNGAATPHRCYNTALPCRALAPQVHEYFGDFVALEAHHFLVPLARPHLAMQPFSWDFGNSSDAISRMTEGVASLMLSLRRRFTIRWVRMLRCAAIPRF